MAPLPKPIGKYHIVAELARGSFGRVYRGVDTSRQHYPVAIKIMFTAHFASMQERYSFLHEAQILSMLRHMLLAALPIML